MKDSMKLLSKVPLTLKAPFGVFLVGMGFDLCRGIRWGECRAPFGECVGFVEPLFEPTCEGCREPQGPDPPFQDLGGRRRWPWWFSSPLHSLVRQRHPIVWTSWGSLVGR